MTGKPTFKDRYELNDVKAAAVGYWPAILNRVAGIDDDFLSNRHGPCPKCGGTDRWRFTNLNDHGGAICNQCGKMGDGFAVIMQITGAKFPEAIKQVAEFIGVQPRENAKSRSKAKSAEKDPMAKVEIKNWNDKAAGFFCFKKKGITPDGMRACGAEFVKYEFKKSNFNCVAVRFPGESLDTEKPAGVWIIDAFGGKLPTLSSPKKHKLTYGSLSGVAMTTALLMALREGRDLSSDTIYRVEGFPDLFSIASQDNSVFAFTPSSGSSQEPPQWFVDRLGKANPLRVVVVPDADNAGIDGANKWAARLAQKCEDVRIATLPFDAAEVDKNDLRDYFIGGGTMAQLDAITDQSEPVSRLDAVPTSIPKALSDSSSDNAEISLFDLGATDNESGRTDLGNAHRFIDQFHNELLSVPAWKCWLSWDGQRWADDKDVGVKQRARRYVRDLWKLVPTFTECFESHILSEANLNKICKFIHSSSQVAKIDAFVRLASTDERVVAMVDELNTDPLLLNVANGTIDLSTGDIRPHNPADRITQLAPVNYDPKAACPKWLQTLSLVFDGDEELIRYVQKLLGYSITGDTGEHLLPICYGGGNNGKSTIWNTVLELLGDYGTLANEDLLLGEKHSHPTEKANLYQKRFIPISEPERGAKLKESRVKELTGDRTITARRMHEDYWSFTRTHTFWLSTNHLPRIDGRDDGIWRRIKLIPFSVNIGKKVEPIKDFDRWLVRNEGPGILAWLVQGYLEYQREGLKEPEVVSSATSGYRDNSDPLKEFFDNFCVVGDGREATANELFEAYSDPSRHAGKWSNTAFGKAMKEHFQSAKATSGPNRNRLVYQGVSVVKVESGNAEPSSENPANNDENEDCAGLRRVSPVAPRQPLPRQVTGNTQRNPEQCPKCGGVLAPAMEVNGWQNLDCLSCEYAIPVKIADGNLSDGVRS